ncbi:outer mitochondrial membrane transport complex protein-domain-containing protein [Mycena amicta]|nr:outer mitochondrial membrane transport complex protein-domain-containing protein [Mycena amicta]
MSSSLPILHVWPGNWDLVSIDAACLATFLYLQHKIPGQFRLAHCTNSDLSPSGSLPFLTHDGHVVSSFYSIIQYLEKLNPGVNADAGLTPVEDAQKTAWCSHAEANLGVLVAYTFYSSVANWEQLVHPTLAYALPVPQRFYVPRRMKNSYKACLAASGLWYQPVAHALPTSNPFKRDHEESLAARRRDELDMAAQRKDQFTEAFLRDKALQHARDTLDRYSRLLGENHFVYREQPTTLDFLISAHVLLLVRPPFPERHLVDLTSAYTALVAHADRILSLCSKHPAPVPETSQRHSFLDLLPRRRTQDDADTHYDRATWGWIALSAGSVAIYLAATGSAMIEQ